MSVVVIKLISAQIPGGCTYLPHYQYYMYKKICAISNIPLLKNENRMAREHAANYKGFAGPLLLHLYVILEEEMGTERTQNYR